MVNQEGLPDYWGIETDEDVEEFQNCCIAYIRKDYPTTGVLKQKVGKSHVVISTWNQEGLPDYWGIETKGKEKLRFKQFTLQNQEGLPDYWGIETFFFGGLTCVIISYQEGLPDYWGIETTAKNVPEPCFDTSDQEGLPDYWGIETVLYTAYSFYPLPYIRKDYPTTGVLKPKITTVLVNFYITQIRKDYPTTGVLKPFLKLRLTA